MSLCLEQSDLSPLFLYKETITASLRFCGTFPLSQQEMNSVGELFDDSDSASYLQLCRDSINERSFAWLQQGNGHLDFCLC